MGIINAIFQAIIQGLTEFLPVSSSGHLSLYQHFTGNSGEGALFFSAILHLGTLVAVFVAFRKTIWDMIKELGVMIKDIFTGKFTLKNMNPPRRMIVMIIVSCFCLVPFLPFKGWFEGIAEDSSIFAEGLCFLYTSAILFMSDRCVKGRTFSGSCTVAWRFKIRLDYLSGTFLRHEQRNIGKVFFHYGHTCYTYELSA